MKKNKIKIFLNLYVVIFLNFAFFLPSFGEEVKYVPLAPIGDKVTTQSFTGSPSDFSTYINNMYKLIVGVAGVLAVLMIMWGGIEYMSTDAIGGKEEAKGRINNALLGLMIALGSYLILQTINQDFLKTDLFVPVANTQKLVIDKETFVGPSGTRGGEKRVGGLSSEGGTSDGTVKNSQWTNEEWKNYALEQVENNPSLLKSKPSDASKWIDESYINSDGTVQPEGWVRLLAGIASKESGFNPNDTYTEKFTNSKGQKVQSVGLLSMSEESAKGYGYNYTTEQLKDPYNNLQVGVSILSKWVSKDGAISGSNNTGAARYWSVVRPGH